MKIYVASSWRNQIQPEVVAALREAGFEVYDFKNPEPGDNGFHWTECDPNWKEWTPEQFMNGLEHPVACAGFNKDMDALESCDLCVLVMPCGRSAHLEAGFAIGAGKPTAILLASGEPELMYKMSSTLCTSIDAIVAWCRDEQIAREIGIKPQPEVERLRETLEQLREMAQAGLNGRDPINTFAFMMDTLQEATP